MSWGIMYEERPTQKEFLITYGYSSDLTTTLYTDIVTAENKKDAVTYLFEQKEQGVYITYIAELTPLFN